MVTKFTLKLNINFLSAGQVIFILQIQSVCNVHDDKIEGLDEGQFLFSGFMQSSLNYHFYIVTTLSLMSILPSNNGAPKDQHPVTWATLLWKGLLPYFQAVNAFM